MSDLRVLLAPLETAGVAGAIRDGLRARGHGAELWTIAPHPFTRTEDRVVTGYPARLRAALAAPRAFDVLHFQFGTTLLEYADAAWGRVAGRPLMLMHYWGDDCRLRLAAGMRPIGAPPGWEREQRARERVIRRRLRLASRLCHAAIVSDLELLAHVEPWFRTVYVVPTPLALPLPVGDPGPEPPGSGPIVLHAPSSPLVKGSATIAAAVARAAAHADLRFVEVHGVPRERVLGELRRADVVVDQLNSSTTGVFALEAMALGRPVLVQYDRTLLAPFARPTPAVAVTADTVEGAVAELVADPARRERLGREGEAFVRSVHGAEAVAGRLERVYRHARTAPAGVFEVTENGVLPLPSAMR